MFLIFLLSSMSFTKLVLVMSVLARQGGLCKIGPHFNMKIASESTLQGTTCSNDQQWVSSRAGPSYYLMICS